MGKATVRILSFVLAGVLLLLAGMGIGIRTQAEYESDVFKTAGMQSTTLAVVNQDMGVEYAGEEINFAQSIIETLGEDVVLVSPAAGEAGLANGAYGALLSFPADFSGKLAGINLRKPERASFRYRVNENLSQKNTIEILLRIAELEKQINDSMSFLYASSVLGELHSAQDTVEELLQNEQNSVDAVREFVTADMSPHLDIPYMEREFPDIDYDDFSEFITRNNQVLTEINEKYDEYMQQAGEDYTTVKDNVSATVSANRLAEAISGIDMLPAGTGDALGYDDQFEYVQAKAELQTIQHFLDLATDLNDARSSLSLAIGTSGMQGLTLGASSLGTSSIEDFSDNLRPDLDLVLEALANKLYTRFREHAAQAVEDELTQTSTGTALGISLQAAGIDLPGTLRGYPSLGMSGDMRDLWNDAGDDIMSDVLNHLDPLLLEQALWQMDVDLDAFNTHMDTYYGSMGSTLASAFALVQLPLVDQLDLVGETTEQLRSYVLSQQSSETSRLSQQANAFDETLNAMVEQVTAYNPTSYIDENRSDFSGLDEDFLDSNAEWERKVSQALEIRTTHIFNTYEEYEEYVRQLQDSMQLTTEEAEALLAEHHARLLTAQLEASANNTGLVGTFSEKLSNTRIGSQGNNDLYNFMVSPVRTLEVGQGAQAAFRPPVQKEVTSVLNGIQWAVYAIAGAFVLTVTVYWVVRGLRRRLYRTVSADYPDGAEMEQ